MNFIKYFFSSFLLLLVVVGISFAGTIHVPADYAKIQLAINASVNGDTVLVAPGTYYENIIFRGKRIVLTSWYALDLHTAYIDSTIINGSQPENPDSASCVRIINGENNSTVLQGFTITGGKGTAWKDEHSSGTYREGGGILTAFSAPIIKNNVIKYNDAYDKGGLTSCGGGGIRSGDGNPQILNNIIMYNRGRYGGGLVLNYCGAQVKNNVFYRNSGGEDFGGGGIWLNSNGPGDKIFENNTVVENSSATDGGGFSESSTSVTIRNNIIWGNTAPIDPQIATNGIVFVSYSDVQGGWSGVGNINVYPMFADTSHYLTPISPCIDKGNPDTTYYDLEDILHPGNAKYPSHGGIRNDMGAYGGQGVLPAPYVDLHLNDPNPPQNGRAYSDYTTPNSVVVSWTDPTRTNDSLPLHNFKIHIYREGTLIAEVDSGVQTFTETGLTLHQKYLYTMNTVVPNDSSSFDSLYVYSGGAAQPSPVSSFVVNDDTNGVQLHWKNPSSQIDGTPLNDFAYVLIFRDGLVIDSIAQSMSDTGQARSYFDPVLKYHTYSLRIRDNEFPVNYSVPTNDVLGYGGLGKLLDENFENGKTDLYTTGTWDTTGQLQHGGSRSITDSPVGNYTQSSSSYFLLPPIILGNEPFLTFYDIAIVRGGSFVYVEISNDGRKTYTKLTTYNAYVSAKWLDGQADSSDWLKEVIDLTAYAGDTATIRFRLTTGSGLEWDGWYVDDITVTDANASVTSSQEVQKGWNMISLPIRVSDLSLQSVYPMAKSRAFIYNKRYVAKDTIVPGTGYFVKFDSNQTIPLTGARNLKDTLLVNTGWNIVGGICVPIDTSAVITLPSGIVKSSYYVFDEAGYHPQDSLMPGKSYWVKSSKNGKLILRAPH